MNLPIAFFIYLAVAAGAGIGFTAAAVLLNARKARIEKATWAAAERYYKRRYRAHDSRL